MKYLGVIIFCICFYMPRSSAQLASTERLTVAARQPLVFSYNNIDDLLQPKTINNAIDLDIKIREANCNIMAQLIYPGLPANQAPPGWVSLKMASKTSNTAIVNNVVTALSSNPVLLFTQPAFGHDEQYNFVYSVVLNPVTTFFRPDNYNFSISFTMTQP